MKLLRQLSNDVYKNYDCTQLAILLEVNDDMVSALGEETKDVHEIAFRVLKKWSAEEGADGLTLYNALNNEPFKHLARKYKPELLQTGMLGLWNS